MMKLRYFLGAFLLLFLIFVAFVCSQLLPTPPKSPEELLEPLTVAQSECVKKITSKDNLVYVEVQEDNNLITVGYNTGDELHAVLVIVDDSNNCTVEFHKVVSERHYSDYGDK